MTSGEVFWLDPGSERTGTFGGPTRRTIKLIRVTTATEPLVVAGATYSVFRDAAVTIELDGREYELRCGPYELPREIDGLQILADLVRDVCGGTVVIPADGSARFAAVDGSLPWTGEGKLHFPIDGYRWRAHVTRTHTWNGFVQVAADAGKVYYHRGEDFGALPDRHDLCSLSEGCVVEVPPEIGDGSSNAIICEGRDLQFRYAHANAETIIRSPASPRRIDKGTKLAKTGNTWQGHHTPDPHLHVGMRDAASARRLNPYPFVVQAYQDTFPDEPLPVAGGYRFTRIGGQIVLDAGASLQAAAGGALTFRWLRSDGGATEGKQVTVAYDEPGTYSEVLYCSDGDGREGYDVAIVRVSPRENGSYAGPPFGYLNTYPVREIMPGTDVLFSFHGVRTGRPRIDFGDGSDPAELDTSVGSPTQTTHSYRDAGWYIATVHCEDAGQGSAELKTIVHVEGA